MHFTSWFYVTYTSFSKKDLEIQPLQGARKNIKIKGVSKFKEVEKIFCLDLGGPKDTIIYFRNRIVP